MNIKQFFDSNLICPNCLKQIKKEIPLKLSGEGYYCDKCQRIYPFKKIVYVLKEKCRPPKCHYKCKETCSRKALTKAPVEDRAYFTLLSLIKKIKTPKISITEKCDNCGQCLKECPLNALIAVNTPVFLPIESLATKNQNNTPDNENRDILLRPLLSEKETRPIFLLLYKTIIKEINKQKTEIIVDSGCGANLFKTFVPEKKNILSIDINANHNAFYPLNAAINGEHLPFKKECIDLFVSTNVLEHITNPLNYLSEMHRTLRDDGKIIITVPTPLWHLSKLLSFHHHLNYWLHILKNPIGFLKNPAKDFNTFWAHEKDCNYENTKLKTAFTKEIREFGAEKWEKLFSDSGLFIEKRMGIGNIFSNNILAVNLIKKLGNSKKRPIHFIYILRKIKWKKITLKRN